jgi:hypothetical protein
MSTRFASRSLSKSRSDSKAKGALSDQLQAEADRLKAASEVHAALAALETAAGVNYPVGEGH